MNGNIGTILTLAWLSIWISLVVALPSPLSDSRNAFFRNFVNHELLAFVGIIVTISLASATGLLIEITRQEKIVGQKIFIRSRNNVRHSAYTMVGSILVSFMIVSLKPLGKGDRWEAFWNGLAVGVVLTIIYILLDFLQAAFELDDPK